VNLPLEPPIKPQLALTRKQLQAEIRRRKREQREKQREQKQQKR